MALNALARKLSARFPWAARLYLRVWGRLTPPTRPHPLFLSLKSQLGVRCYRKARLRSGEVLKCDPFDSVGRELFRNHVYEPETLDVFEVLCPTGGVVLDIGSHVGQYTLRAARLVGADGIVHAFEPDPQTYAILKWNTRRNRLSNAVLHAAGLSNTPGEAEFYTARSENIGGGSLRRNRSSSGAAIRVKLETVDQYADVLPRLDLIKIDVEGAEHHVLEGASSLIRKHRPAIILELSVNSTSFGYSSGDVAAWLSRSGYEIFRIGPAPLERWRAQPSDPAWYNVLAVTSELGAALASKGVLRQ